MNATVPLEIRDQKVLIVDDASANLGVAVDHLEGRGFQVLVAQDGEEALARARFARPDLILLDVLMPGLDGFETCRRLKADDATRDIPVIFMTALAEVHDKVAGFAVGGADYVTKPFQVEELAARVETHLLLRATQKRLAAQNQRLNAELAHRREIEAQLRISEQRFRAIAEVSGDWLWEMGPDLRFTHISENFGIATRTDPACLMGKTRWQFAGIDLEVDDHWRKHKADLEARRPFRQFRYGVTGANGRRRWLAVSGSPLFDDDGQFLGYRGSATDETATVEARERAEKAEAMLRDAVDSISEGFVIYDADDRLVMCNERYRELYPESADYMAPGVRFEDILRGGLARGQYVDALGREEDWLAERLADHRKATGVVEQRLGSGRHVLVTERRMRNGGIAGLRIDITALKEAQAAVRELERQLLHSQKLEALGTLAGGIAHDLNNALQPILALANFVCRRAPEGSTERKDVEMIQAAALRARDLVRQILAFGRKDAGARTLFEPASVAREALGLLRRSIPATIAIVDDIQDALPILGDAGQFQQVVVNLVTNASQAIGEGKGVVAVTLEADRTGTPNGREAVRLVVRDTGCGMDQATIDRIFEPFFTTKAVGEGTGLGLSVVHGIVTSHGGRIDVCSQPGDGTCITILMPAAEGATATQMRRSA